MKPKGPAIKLQHMRPLNAPWNAPVDSWWMKVHPLGFYPTAKSESERMRNSRIHHQLQKIRVIGLYED